MFGASRKGETSPNERGSGAVGGNYIIRIKEYLSPDWSEMYEGLVVTYTDGGETILSGCIHDQSALHGLLARIRDLNLTLISVIRVPPK